MPLRKARFTADSNPVLNIDAGSVGGHYFLATGGAIENKTTKLRAIINLDSTNLPTKVPMDLPLF